MAPVYNFATNCTDIFIGEVLELADRRDLGSRAERREGSNPPSLPNMMYNPFLFFLTHSGLVTKAGFSYTFLTDYEVSDML